MNHEPPLNGLHDFDFLAGIWQVRHRRLKRRHVGSNEWAEFPGTSRMEILLGGLMNVDENEFPTLGRSGASIRVYDLKTQQWSIYWIRSDEGILLPPVVGCFKDGAGEFVGEDSDQGIPIKARFRWTHDGAKTAHWEQAFSWDGGKTWETNWTMDFFRLRGGNRHVPFSDDPA